MYYEWAQNVEVPLVRNDTVEYLKQQARRALELREEVVVGDTRFRVSFYAQREPGRHANQVTAMTFDTRDDALLCLRDLAVAHAPAWVVDRIDKDATEG